MSDNYVISNAPAHYIKQFFTEFNLSEFAYKLI